MEIAINKLETKKIIDMINGLLAILDSRRVKIKKDNNSPNKFYIVIDKINRQDKIYLTYLTLFNYY